MYPYPTYQPPLTNVTNTVLMPSEGLEAILQAIRRPAEPHDPNQLLALSGNPPITREAEGFIEGRTGEGTEAEEVGGEAAVLVQIDEEGDWCQEIGLVTIMLFFELFISLMFFAISFYVSLTNLFSIIPFPYLLITQDIQDEGEARF